MGKWKISMPYIDLMISMFQLVLGARYERN